MSLSAASSPDEAPEDAVDRPNVGDVWRLEAAEDESDETPSSSSSSSSTSTSSSSCDRSWNASRAIVCFFFDALAV
jgi:hypothetical protein